MRTGVQRVWRVCGSRLLSAQPPPFQKRPAPTCSSFIKKDGRTRPPGYLGHCVARRTGCAPFHRPASARLLPLAHLCRQREHRIVQGASETTEHCAARATTRHGLPCRGMCPLCRSAARRGSNRTCPCCVSKTHTCDRPNGVKPLRRQLANKPIHVPASSADIVRVDESPFILEPVRQRLGLPRKISDAIAQRTSVSAANPTHKKRCCRAQLLTPDICLGS